ncbi:class I SAM-dependent methyltransferase [Tuberibacillus sp. Marseille-P3662]|uniref:class I SAM-dependent methyltransferase n=1 Tax=Tuberibacillus sp. Marseille-P3662 TaxID=1965358 RepID=UPI000A1CA0DA|nr:class I SAM-dependent methyltransferase [Tuberibacillus sp. Marseille-P3662]
MTIKGVIAHAHMLLQQVISKGDTVVDATAGNGHDTEFLAKRVGETGQVLAFDIQQAAIHSTKGRLETSDLDHRVTLINDSHERIDDYINEPVQAAIFNLGYLPGGNTNIVTHPNATWTALTKLGEQLVTGGIIAVVVYPGHDQGYDESSYLLQQINALPKLKWRILKYEVINPNQPPYLLALEKLKHKGDHPTP